MLGEMENRKHLSSPEIDHSKKQQGQPSALGTGRSRKWKWAVARMAEQEGLRSGPRRARGSCALGAGPAGRPAGGARDRRMSCGCRLRVTVTKECDICLLGTPVSALPGRWEPCPTAPESARAASSQLRSKGQAASPRIGWALTWPQVGTSPRAEKAGYL